MKSLNTFIRIIGLIPEVKKIFIDQWLERYYCILGRIQAKQGIAKQVWFAPNTVGESGGGASQATGTLCYYYPHLRLETVFLPALKLTQNCYINMNISFS